MKKKNPETQNQAFSITSQSSTILSQLGKTKSIFFQAKTNFVFQNVTLPSETLNQQLKIYEWRNNIQKGIVKCLWTCILPLQKNELVMETKRKYYPYNLKSLGKMSLGQLTYIFKELLVGFQILYNEFGCFKVQEQMVNFSENFEVQVWGCKNLCSNYFQLNDMNEHTFLCSILRMLQNHQIKTNLTDQFYYGLLRFDLLNFKNLKNYVQTFTKIHQLIIPSQNFIKQTFFKLERKRQTLSNQSKSLQKKYHSNNSCQSGKDFNLIFSPSKKPQRKRLNGFKTTSENFLKDSDITTQEGDLQNKNNLTNLMINNEIQKQKRNYFHSSYDFKYENSLNSQDNFPFNVLKVQSKEELQKDQKARQVFEKSLNQHGFLKFRKAKADFSFFNCIDDLAESKQMINSIKIGPEIRKQSSVSLQKLGKFKLKMHESIITEQNFFPSTEQ